MSINKYNLTLAFVRETEDLHVFPLAQALHRHLGDNFRLIYLKPQSISRMGVGWGMVGADCPWVLRYWEKGNVVEDVGKWLNEADVVIFPSYWGNDPTPECIRHRLARNKLSLAFNEARWRFEKRGVRFAYRIIRSMINEWSLVRHPLFHCLAVGGNSAWDSSRMGVVQNHIWKFGYSTQVPDTICDKPISAVRFLWAGRFVDWKRVDVLLLALAKLNTRYSNYRCDIFGQGPDEAKLMQLASQLKLDSTVVTFHPLCSHQQLAVEMKKAHVFVLPSKGWGVVINEAMGHGCAIICNREAGAAQSLVMNGKTGFLFPSGDSQSLSVLMERFLIDDKLAVHMGREGWHYLRTNWAPDVAAHRLLLLAASLQGRFPAPHFAEGIISPAVIRQYNRIDKTTFL